MAAVAPMPTLVTLDAPPASGLIGSLLASSRGKLTVSPRRLRNRTPPL